MFTLYVDFEGNATTSSELIRVFREIFRPAISRQPGFAMVDLQQAADAGVRRHRLVIGFDHQADQKSWVVTDLHQRVWPQMEALIGTYSVSPFESR